MNIRCQKRSNVVDVLIDIEVPGSKPPMILQAVPVQFRVMPGRSTDPGHALLTLTVTEARQLAQTLLREAGSEGS